MVTKNKRFYLLLAAIFAITLYFFYDRYVPLVKDFQISLFPFLSIAVILTTFNIQWGTLYFIFCFPLINNLPYFFGLYEPLPLAPTALVLFLFYFLGWLLYHAVHKSEPSLVFPIFKPVLILLVIILISGIVTFFRYANFYPFLSDYVYELITNAFGVTAGGAIMSVFSNSLNYFTGLAFFFILLNAAKSKEFIKNIIIILCANSLISLLFGLFQHLKNMKLGNNPISIYQELINATFKDALSFGAYIAIIFPLIFGIFLAFKGIIRILSFIVIILSLYMILFSGSKSSILSLSISLLFFLFFSSKLFFDLIKSKSFSFKRIHLSSFIIFLIVVIVSGVLIFDKALTKEITKSSTFIRFRDMAQARNFSTIFNARADTLWKLAMLMIRDYPLSGVGIGGYVIESSNYSKIYKISLEIPESAENYLLQVGSELGFIGIFLVLWIFWDILKQMKRSSLQIPSRDKSKFILIGAIAGVISFLVSIQAHTFIGSYEIKYTFWLLVGLIFSLGSIAEAENKKEQKKGIKPKLRCSKGLKISSIILIVLFAGAQLWNSTHSLSLKSRTEKLGFKQEFGLDKLEKTRDGREFRWTREYGGKTLKIEKPILMLPLHASHPDIKKKPVRVKIYLVKEFFKQKKLLKEISLAQSDWQAVTLSIPEEVGSEVILLIKVSRTWNPLKTIGTPDPRNLGVAIGRIEFKDKI